MSDLETAKAMCEQYGADVDHVVYDGGLVVGRPSEEPVPTLIGAMQGAGFVVCSVRFDDEQIRFVPAEDAREEVKVA